MIFVAFLFEMVCGTAVEIIETCVEIFALVCLLALSASLCLVTILTVPAWWLARKMSKLRSPAFPSFVTPDRPVKSR
jgi:hypothetical protein